MLWHIAYAEPETTPPDPVAIVDIHDAAIVPATGPVLENPRKYKGIANKAPIRRLPSSRKFCIYFAHKCRAVWWRHGCFVDPASAGVLSRLGGTECLTQTCVCLHNFYGPSQFKPRPRSSDGNYDSGTAAADRARAVAAAAAAGPARPPGRPRRPVQC